MQDDPRWTLAIVVCTACGLLPQSTLSQELKLVREIGAAEGSSEYNFFEIADLALGPRGEVVVLDGGAKSVLLFNSDGAPLRRFGREGAGPGEFMAPNRIRIEGEEIVVVDWWQSRVTRFSMEGEVLNTSPLPQPPDARLSRANPLADGSVIGLSSFRAVPRSAGHNPSIQVLRLTQGRVDTLLNIEPGYVTWQAVDGSSFGVVPERLGRTGAVAVAGDSAVALTDAVSAELRVILVSDAGFRPLPPVAVPIVAREVSEGTLERLRKNLRNESPQLPSNVELIPPSRVSLLTGNSFFDDKGAVWIETRSEESQAERQWMVIARSPSRSRWVPVPESLQLVFVDRDHAYGIWTDDLDVQTVRIYRLK